VICFPQLKSSFGIMLVGLFALVTPGCRSTPRHEPAAIQHTAHYPAHWWTPVSKEGAPAWEILPQEARPGEVILSKRNELGLLSNFAPTPFTFRGQRYASLEGFWQMMKYPENTNDARATFPGLHWDCACCLSFRRNASARWSCFQDGVKTRRILTLPPFGIPPLGGSEHSTQPDRINAGLQTKHQRSSGAV
jgi:hypothetical protein